MQKRGQMYIVSAIIIGVVIFGLASRSNILEKKDIEDEFDDISENYVFESSEVVNYGINKNYKLDKELDKEKNLFKLFNDFTSDFLEYSGKKDEDIGVLYVLSKDGDVTVKNCLKGEKGNKVEHNNSELSSCDDEVESVFCLSGTGCISVGDKVPERYSSSSGKGKVKIDDIDYDLDYEGKGVGVGYIIIKEDEEDVKIKTNAK